MEARYTLDTWRKHAHTQVIPLYLSIYLTNERTA